MLFEHVTTPHNFANCDRFGDPTVIKVDSESLGQFILPSNLDTGKVYFDFLPYHAGFPTGLTPAEIFRVKRELENRHPGLVVRRPPHQLPSFGPLPEDAFPDPTLQPVWQFSNRGASVQMSIVIPTHNSASYLVNVIRHLVEQKYDKELFEIIIVDDGSTDNSAAEVFSFSRHLNGINIKYFFWPKRTAGIYRAGQSRQVGVYHSAGEQIVFLDSDMLAPPNFLSEVYGSLKNSDIVQFVRHHIPAEKGLPSIQYQSANSTRTYVEETKYWTPFFNAAQWSELPQYWKYTCTYALAVNKKIFVDLGGFYPNFTTYGFEDTDLGYRYHKAGKRFELNKLVLYHLTAPNKRHSYLAKQARIARSARIFYLNHLDEEIYTHFHRLLSEPSVYLFRLLDRFRIKSKSASRTQSLR